MNTAPTARKFGEFAGNGEVDVGVREHANGEASPNNPSSTLRLFGTWTAGSSASAIG